MGAKRTAGRYHAASVASVALITLTLAVGMAGTAFGVAQPATGLSAFVNGTALHVHVLQLPPKVVDADEAFAVSAINSDGFKPNTTLVNEVNEGIVPVAGKAAFARGGGVEVGLGEPVPNDAAARAIELSTIESSPTATIPFTDGLQVTNTVDLGGALDPLVNASVLGGRAATLWNPNYAFPTLGNPLTYAYGQAADVQALNTASNPSLDALGRFITPVLSTNSDPNAPDRSVASSQTFTYLVNNGDGTCGLAAETHMSIAPVNIAVGNLLIEVGGDWLMKAVATGKATGNSFTYGPDPAGNAPNTPLVRVIDTSQSDPSKQVLGQITTQDILGPGGLSLPANPLIDLSVGEAARAIAPPQADGSETDPDPTSAPTHTATKVSAAADVVRLRLLSGIAPPFQLADLRLGHFETKLDVPAGGVNCQIPVAKTSSVPVASAGQAFTFTVKVPSDTKAVEPFPCDMSSVTLNDVLSVEKANDPSHPPKMNLVSGTGPNGQTGTPSADLQSMTFPSGPTWKPGAPPLVYTIKAVVASDSGTGIMKDTATATAAAANCSGQKSILGSVIGLITGDVTGAGNGSVAGSANFFGSTATGLTGNIRGGGPVKINGNGFLAGPKVGVAVLGEKLPTTGLDDRSLDLLGLFALLATAILAVFLRRGSRSV